MPDDPSVRQELAATYYHMGLVAGEIDSREKALEWLEAALDLQRALAKEAVEDQTESVEVLSDLANTCNAIGNIKRGVGNLPEASQWRAGYPPSLDSN